jgi:hypothetical protein
MGKLLHSPIVPSDFRDISKLEEIYLFWLFLYHSISLGLVKGLGLERLVVYVL